MRVRKLLLLVSLSVSQSFVRIMYLTVLVHGWAITWLDHITEDWILYIIATLG